MPLIIGIILIPIIITIIIKSYSIEIKKRTKILLNILLILISIIYLLLCCIIQVEPFNFENYYSSDYMFYSGTYIINLGVIFLFTPFIWIVVIHFLKIIISVIRVRKNAIIKNKKEYIYYKEDLDRISPSIIMFTSTFEIDIKKSISATILKLKLNEYIKEENDRYICSGKDESSLPESEKMVLNLIRHNNFNKSEYKKAIEKETLKNKYIVKNYGGIPFRILKIITAICMPILVFVFSVYLDQYLFNNYKVWPEDDGYTYIILKNEDEIEQLYYNEVDDQNDYYHQSYPDGSISYNYAEIRADKLKYSIVRKRFYLTLLSTFLIGFFGIFVLAALYIVSTQIRYINKNYRRTVKGNILLNKAYALKNYLKEYSLIKSRTEKELILWEYYLIYAVVLNVNVKVEESVIKKYV